MPEIIPFPEKEEQLRASGTRKMLAHDYLAAKKDFELLCEQAPTFENYQLLIEIFRLLGDFEGAVFYAEPYEPEYLSNKKEVEYYLRLLLLDGQYLRIHRLLQKYPNERVQKDLIQLEGTQDLIGESEYLAKEYQLKIWDQKGLPIIGRQWNIWLKRMSLTRFIHLVKEYLSVAHNPFLPPKLVEELLACGVKETLIVKDLLDEKRAVSFSELKLLEESRELDLLLRLISEVWENEDPQMAEGIALEAQAHFALLYPFLPPLEEIPEWAESYRLEYQGMFGDEKAIEALKEYQNIQELKQKVREIYQELS